MIPSSAESDADHALRAQLDRLVCAHRKAMVSFARRFAPEHDAENAEGITQDALLMILERRVALPDDDHRAIGVVMHVIRNVARNRRRHEELRRTKTVEEDRRIPVTAEDASWRALSRGRTSREVTAALVGLTHAEREVVTLHVIHDLSLKEVAERRGCAIRTVKELYRRAVPKLRAALRER
jgi:RNA polymerase sigma factor (sigma-70 family)